MATWPYSRSNQCPYAQKIVCASLRVGKKIFLANFTWRRGNSSFEKEKNRTATRHLHTRNCVGPVVVQAGWQTSGSSRYWKICWSCGFFYCLLVCSHLSLSAIGRLTRRPWTHNFVCFHALFFLSVNEHMHSLQRSYLPKANTDRKRHHDRQAKLRKFIFLSANVYGAFTWTFGWEKPTANRRGSGGIPVFHARRWLASLELERLAAEAALSPSPNLNPNVEIHCYVVNLFFLLVSVCV